MATILSSSDQIRPGYPHRRTIRAQSKRKNTHQKRRLRAAFRFDI
jgi:hypothetical protein